MVKTKNYRKNNKRSVKKNKIVKKKTQKGYGRTKKESVCNVEGKEAEIIKLIENGAVYMTFQKGESNKFWQIVVEGNKTISTHGKIGSARPSETEKTHEDSKTSIKFALSQICSKLDKGYEVSQKEKLSGRSALEKLEKAKQAIESQIKRAKELVQQEKVDKEEERVEKLKKEISSLDIEIEKMNEKRAEIDTKLLSLLQRKKEAESSIREIISSQEKIVEKEGNAHVENDLEDKKEDDLENEKEGGLENEEEGGLENEEEDDLEEEEDDDTEGEEEDKDFGVGHEKIKKNEDYKIIQ